MNMMRRKHGDCPTCDSDDNPCPVVRSAKRLLGAWARERRRQLGADAPNVWLPTPDKAAMEAAVEGIELGDCDCPCHKASCTT